VLREEANSCVVKPGSPSETAVPVPAFVLPGVGFCCVAGPPPTDCDGTAVCAQATPLQNIASMQPAATGCEIALHRVIVCRSGVS
jgi:hypothetical protein